MSENLKLLLFAIHKQCGELKNIKTQSHWDYRVLLNIIPFLVHNCYQVLSSFFLLKYAISQNIAIDKRTPRGVSRLGRIDILKWLFDRQCPWDCQTINIAAFVGHFEIVKMCISRKKLNENEIRDICASAALGGHLHIFNLFYHEFNSFTYGSVFQNAIIGGNIDIVKLCLKNSNTVWWISNIFPTNTAVVYNNFEIFKLLLEHNFPCNCYSVPTLKLEYVKWTVEKGLMTPKKNLNACNIAAFVGNLQVLKYLFSKGFKMDIVTFLLAAYKNHFHVLDWICENRYPTELSIMNDENEVETDIDNNNDFQLFKNKKLRYWMLKKGFSKKELRFGIFEKKIGDPYFRVLRHDFVFLPRKVIFYFKDKHMCWTTTI